MSFLFARRDSTSDVIAAMSRNRGTGSAASATLSEAMRLSACWAILRLRADLESSMPLDAYQEQDGRQKSMPLPPVLDDPLGDGSGAEEWRYASRVDLDSVGNTFGIILKWSQYGKPLIIEPVSTDDVTVRGRGARITGYKIKGKDYTPFEVWHERQYVTSGSPMGLSPIAYAAYSLQTSLSAQSFARDWFNGTALPAAHLKNTARTLEPGQSSTAKSRFKADTANGDLFVTGNDWSLTMLAAKASDAMFLEQQNASTADICRFLGAPGDIIDAPTQGSSITYANITQRNLQFLIMHMGPAINRREKKWSRGLLPGATYVKLNRNSLLEMDLASRYASYAVALDKRILAPSEIRALENRAPLTPEQIAEFATLFNPNAQPQTKELV